MALTEAGAKALALIAKERRLQEAQDSGDMSTNDLCKWLTDGLNDCKPYGCNWCYYVDFIGDGESGKLIFCCDGDLTQVPYTISKGANGINVEIDMTSAVDVLQVTSYMPETDQVNPAVFPGMEAAIKAGLYTPGDVPLCERTIAKAERDAADSGSFAGKGQSFPILKKGDAKAAAASIGRAGPGNKSKSALKASIKRIAKKKGLASELPQTWKDEDKASEAAMIALLPKLSEAGARHSKADMDMIQAIHDHSADLGATCADDDESDSNDNGVTGASEAASPKKAAQAMHDKATNQKAHDAGVKLGAKCPPDCKFGDNGGDDDTSESFRTDPLPVLGSVDLVETVALRGANG